MTKAEIRADGLHLSGYVNAVGRDSRPIVTESGYCVEQIAPGAFTEAIRAAENILLKLDHGRVLGSTKEGSLKLAEDNIGLRAEAVISDKEVIRAAERGELRGWSFGFLRPVFETEERGEKLPRRIVTALELTEVSVIDSAMRPCYAGTSVEVRADGKEELFGSRVNEDGFEVTKIPDYKALKEKIKNM